MFTPASKFISVRSADSSLRDSFWLKCKQWRIYWVNQCKIPSDTRNNLQIHHRVFIAMNQLCFARYPSDRYPSFSLGVGEFLFVYCGKPFMHMCVPWHQFVYTLCIPCGRLVFQPVSSRSSPFAKRLPARYSFIFGKRKRSDGAKSGLYEGCSKMCQWNCSRSKACAFRAVSGRTLSCNRTIPRESLPLRQNNLRSHRSAENE